MFSIKTGDLCNLHTEIYISRKQQQQQQYSSSPDINTAKASCALKSLLAYKSVDLVLLGPGLRPTGSVKTKMETS